MWSLFPERASEIAGQVDALYTFLVIVSGVMTLIIFGAVFFMAMVYRRTNPNERPAYVHGSLKLEIAWSLFPLLVMMVIFAWSTVLYFRVYTSPPDPLNVYVTGKQWMWKVQYPEGQREINELHVPVGRPVRLTMASEDVIHSFFIPAFRIKRDVVPGHYNTVAFTPSKAGRYHLFCAEYCGTQHSGMIGWVTVLDPVQYETWLANGGSDSMASQGQKMFQQMGCSTCHLMDEAGRCPNLRNLYGHPVQLDDGRTVIADEAYIRESILEPNAKIVYAYKRDVMPTFQGQISEEGILQLIEYIKSLSQPGAPPIGAGVTGKTTGQARFGDTGNPSNAHAGTTIGGQMRVPVTEPLKGPGVNSPQRKNQ